MFENLHNLKNKKRLTVAFVLFGVFCSLTSTALGETTCRSMQDRRWPGLEECTVRAEISAIEAESPEPQKRPLWCWAASMSMIFTSLDHSISQESIVSQNFGGALPNTTSGPFPITEARLNRRYKDDNGDWFTSSSTRILTMQDAADTLNNDIPLLYTYDGHAVVQTELVYQQAPGGPMVIKGGRIWDPWPGRGWRRLGINEVRTFIAAWSLSAD